MNYEAALSKAWGDLGLLSPPVYPGLRFLGRDYSVDSKARTVVSLPDGSQVKVFSVILILHYLIQRLKGLPRASGVWLNFRELSGVEGYSSAFRKRSLEPIIKKYGDNPQGVLAALERIPGERIEGADASVVLEAFENVPVLIRIWRGDEEFGPDANMFFDRSISGIFCIEDIVVLAGMVAGAV